MLARLLDLTERQVVALILASALAAAALHAFGRHLSRPTLTPRSAP